MSMKLVKKTAEYSIYQRGDERYAVKNAARQPVNGEEKVKILLAEGLIKVTEPSAPEPEALEEAPAESEDAGEEAAEDGGEEAAEGDDA